MTMPATSLLITAQKMRREQEEGRVRYLHPEIHEFLRWCGVWWIQSADPPGWLRVTDSWLASRLDRIKLRLDIAEDNRACEEAMNAENPDGPSRAMVPGASPGTIPAVRPTAPSTRQ